MVFKTMCVDEITQMCGCRQEKTRASSILRGKRRNQQIKLRMHC